MRNLRSQLEAAIASSQQPGGDAPLNDIMALCVNLNHYRKRYCLSAAEDRDISGSIDKVWQWLGLGDKLT